LGPTILLTTRSLSVKSMLSETKFHIHTKLQETL
jgi:hypothetical protein